MFGPSVPTGVDLDPFVVKLWRFEDVDQAVKCPSDFDRCAGAETADDNGRAVDQWKPPPVKVIAVAGDQYPAETQCLCRVILVGMASQPGFLDSQNVRAQPPQYFRGQAREILVRIESGFGSSPDEVQNLTLFAFGRRVGPNRFFYVDPGHF